MRDQVSHMGSDFFQVKRVLFRTYLRSMNEPSSFTNVKWRPRAHVASWVMSLAVVAATAVGPVAAWAQDAADTFFKSPSFWLDKPKLQTKLRDERAVLVSVKTEPSSPKDRFTIQGVGHVRREPKAAFELAKDFERLKEISDHFREVKHDPKQGKVFVICQALGYQARMLFRVETVSGTDRLIKFEVIDGHFLGLRGELKFAPVDGAGGPASPMAPSEVSLRVFLEASEIPIPRILVGIALEILVQRVAIKMRTHLETAELQ